MGQFNPGIKREYGRHHAFDTIVIPKIYFIFCKLFCDTLLEFFIGFRDAGIFSIVRAEKRFELGHIFEGGALKCPPCWLCVTDMP